MVDYLIIKCIVYAYLKVRILKLMLVDYRT